MPEKKNGLIICDFDGVCNEGSPELYYEGYYIAFSGVGCDLSVEEQRARIDKKWGSSHKVIIEYVLAENPEFVPFAVDIFEDFMESGFAERIREVPGCAEMLGRLVAKYNLALNTAAPRKSLMNNIMPKLGIDPALFDAGIVTADQLNAGFSKPSPYVINILRAQQGYPLSETVMIGDSVADMESAKNAKVEPIAVTGTGNLTTNSVKDLPYVRYSIEKVTDVEAMLPHIFESRKKIGHAGLGGFGMPQMSMHA